ncbi:MAG: cell wall-binding repeat-containing protein, partial [Actinomycetota bacterium]|nr:cell wall-binding repeat-containing protein [Actinomycetota bacterium]
MTKRAVVLAAAMAASILLVAVAGAQAEVRVGKNYRLKADDNGFRGKDAVALAVNPRNPNHVVQISNEYLAPNCEGTASFDGGVTWSTADELPAPDPFAPACSLIGDHLAESQYQTVAFGSGQNVYAAYATRNNILGQSIILGKSTDGGRTWTTATVAMQEGNAACAGSGTTLCPYYELPSLAVDPGAAGGQDRVYVAAKEITSTGLSTAGDAAVAVSNDSGLTFGAPVAAEGPTEDATDTSQPAIAPNGDVYVAWRTRGAAGSVKIARSDNQGQTWNTPVEVATVVNAASTSNTDPPAPLASTGSSFPRIAVGPNGNVYIVYNQGAAPPGGTFTGADHFIPPDSDVYFQRSATRGAQWSTPKLINDATVRPGHESPYNPPALGRVTQTRHPNVAVAPNGRVHIVWQDRRHWYRGCVHTHVICAEARLGDTYWSSSTDNGSSFSANRRISDRSHNNDVGYDYRFGVGWAFGPVVAPQGNNGLIVGWMDSRNGSFETDTQDIFLARVNLNAPATVPQESIQRSDNVTTSVRLSHHTYPGGGESLLASTFASRPGTRVVIANENDFPSILSGGVLARANLSTVLLSPASGLPATVKAEVERLKPAGAYIMGGTDSLSGQVQDDLEAAGVDAGQIQRLSGADDAATAASVATTLDRRTDAEKAANSPPAFNAVAVVNPASPDASAVAGLAAARRLPILFVGRDSVPAATSDAISELDIDKALVIGGSQWVSDDVLNDLPNATRLGGADQYATSGAVVAESVARGLPPNIAYVADGSKPIDGALLGPVVGRVTGLMALSRAPLSSSAVNSGEIDRMILLAPAAGPPPGPAANPPASPPPTNCPSGTSAGVSCQPLPGGGRRITGTPGNDTIVGTAANDIIR